MITQKLQEKGSQNSQQFMFTSMFVHPINMLVAAGSERIYDGVHDFPTTNSRNWNISISCRRQIRQESDK